MSVAPEKLKLLPVYEEGLKLYKKKKFREAKEKFEECLKLVPKDGPSKVYLERCDTLMKEPPSPDWDGVFVMTTK